MKRFPGLFIPIQSVVTVVCFGIALPIAIALFPQTTQVSVCVSLICLFVHCIHFSANSISVHCRASTLSIRHCS